MIILVSKEAFPLPGHLRSLPRKGRKTETAEAVPRPPRGATRDRLGPDVLRPAYHHRRGPHRRDVDRRCRLLDPCRLDQAGRIEPAERPDIPPYPLPPSKPTSRLSLC